MISVDFLSDCMSVKTVSVLQRLHGEIGRTMSDVQKRGEQTDKKLNVFGHVTENLPMLQPNFINLLSEK